MISKENLQEQLNQMSREQLVDSYIQMAEKQEKLEKQLINLQQSVAMLNQQRFGTFAVSRSLCYLFCTLTGNQLHERG